jgi:3-(3-hydroxy-phenyl)propionate hydroxylase
MDLAQRGVASVVLQALDTVSEGSRALCWSKRTLEILDRLGVAEGIIARGFTWNSGRLYHGDEEVYHFDLKPEGDQKFPAFVNLQQYYAEDCMLEGVARHGELIDLRWLSRLTDLRQDAAGVTATVETPEGRYDLQGEYLIACDGAKSTVRRVLGQDFVGRAFEDHFLIADVDVEEPLPWTERRFWFLPSFHKGETALCHRQGEGMWRVDFQLGWDGVDPKEEVKPERALPRIKGMLGDVPMQVTWLSVYTFQCRRLARFRHGRVVFAGDAAHQVSPFGARGGNSGIQDAENLAWKLALVLDGRAPDALLDSYHEERGLAADENIMHASRTTDFMTAKTPLRARMRAAVLGLAKHYPFAQAMINSGRLSTATTYADSPLSTPADGVEGGIPPGAPVPNVMTPGNDDAGFLLDRIGRGLRFEALWFVDGVPDAALAEGLKALEDAEVPLATWLVGTAGDPRFASIADPEGRLARTFAAEPGTLYLLRPDQHVAACWRAPTLAQVRAAMDRALMHASAAAHPALAGTGA